MDLHQIGVNLNEENESLINNLHLANLRFYYNFRQEKN